MPSLSGQTVVITGANSGIGYEATKQFAQKGARVVMACRSLDRGREAADEIRSGKESQDSEFDLDVRHCDLASLESIRRFADDLARNYSAVDILCNNAGLMAIPRRETEDGFEMQFGVNHLGHFALTGRLFPLLEKSDGESRVVTHSSRAHQRGEMDFSDLNWEESYDKWSAYARSKLANLLFAYELQRRIEQAGVSGVKSVACHPGYVDTNLQTRTAEESSIPLMHVLVWIANRLFAQKPDQGAYPMLYAATADLKGSAYVGPDGLLNLRGYPEIQRSSDASYDEDDAHQLWERSTKLTGVEFPFEKAPTPRR